MTDKNVLIFITVEMLASSRLSRKVSVINSNVGGNTATTCFGVNLH